MRLFLLLFLFCIEFLGYYHSVAVTPEHVDKPSSSKAKLAKEEFTAGLKKMKQNPSTRRTEVDWDSAQLGFTPPPEQANDMVEFDGHTYYNSTFYANSNDGKLLWVDIDAFPQEQIITHDMLSSSHRQATTVEMSFDFPFYGSKLRNITIATGGFLYMGDYLHNWIAATQYIAPLMANFDTTLSNNSTIKYADNGTMFTVQWDHVHLQDRQNDGSFTFQVNLFKNGDISFAYQEIPFTITTISDENHPVKVGLSDAYILERQILFIRRKTIYEYHRIDMVKKNIGNNTGIHFKALPTCLDYSECDSCMAAPEALECMWCDTVQRCSDGVDRNRQSWVAAGCILQHPNSCQAAAPEKPETTPTTDAVSTTSAISYTVFADTSTEPTQKPARVVSTLPPNSIINRAMNPEKSDLNITASPPVAERVKDLVIEKDSASVSPGAIVTIIVFIAVVMAIGLWVFYAYRFPQSSSGQFLIKYRPNQWSFKPEGHESTSNAFHM